MRIRSTLEPLTIRLATPDDTAELRRLAQLDSGRVPAGPTLVAEVDGVLAAALPLEGGGPVADPFLPTAEAVRVLEMRAAQIEGARRRGARFSVNRPASPATSGSSG
jgi:hypothetical protein